MNRRVAALAFVAALAISSCATDSYHAYEAGEGYSEQRLGDETWRVSFVGSTLESQATVEQQLLRRAAELTVQNGFDWFAPSGQESQQEEEIVVTGERPVVNADSVGPVWRPRWRRRSASRWTDWDPQGALATSDAPEPPPPAATSAQRYSAAAEISMGRGARPPGAFDARAVLAGGAPG
jgi:hypothetical protein